MRSLDSIRLRIAALFHRSELNAEMDDELASHIQLRADDLERSGLSRAEAERRARIEFGGQERYKDEIHEASRGTSFVETLFSDVRFSLRVLKKSPGFTMVAIATLALAIGANAIVFAVLNALILRPVNVPEAQSLWSIQRGSQKAINHSYPDYLDLRDRNRSFEGLAAYDLAPAGLDTGGDPASAWIMEATGNYFDVLKVHPYLGRFFHSADEHGPNSAPYIVLTYAYWHSHFQDDRNVIGRVVQLNKHPFTILGVAPPEFRGTLLFVFPDFWVPLVNQEQVEGVDVRNERSNHFLLMMLGHLKPGVTPAQAVSDLNSIGASLEKTYPKDDAQMTFSLTRPGLAGDWLGGPLQAFLSGLMLLAALILLAACANLGSLFAARAADRSREVALRLSLGASRGRILRQLFTEAILISLIGGAAGLWGSILLLRALSVWHPMPTAPLQIPIHADWHVYTVAVLLSLASGFLFGAVPVTQVLRTDAYQVIKSGPAATAWRRLTVRDLLLVAQIAICAVLVTASLVAVRGLMRSLHSNFGFEAQSAMLVVTSLSMGGYQGEQIPLMQKRMIEALENIPGVTDVGSVDRLPLYYGANFANVFTDQTADLNPANAAASAATYNISPGYFDAAGTTLLAGRQLSWHDDKNAPRVAVVNREFARRVLGSVPDSLGRYFKLRDGSRVQVVGLVEDGKYGTLAEDIRPAVFLPVTQGPPSSDLTLVVRSNRDPQQVADAVSSAVRGLDAGLPFTIRTWKQELAGALFPSRMATLALGVFGIIGAVLSITGVFGMAAYSVSKRMRELGIRIALGAQRQEVLSAALGRAIRLLIIGSAAGLVFGLIASRVLASIVYQASPRDPLVLFGAVLAMALLGLLATWIPAHRALSADPLILLREE
jgi:predicted permease